MRCPRCGSERIGERPERTAQGYRRFRCRTCGKQFNERSDTLLNRAQYPSDVIALVVLWRLRYQLSLRDLAEMFLARGICFAISGPSIPIQDDWFTAVAINVVELPGGTFLSYGAVLALVVVAIAAYVLHRTRFGRTVYAIGGSESSAALMGLAVGRTKVGVYVISGFCSALAGLLFSVYILSGWSLHGIGLELDAIAAVVIGGTVLVGGRGLVFGSLLGVLVLGTIKALIDFDGGLNSWWTKITVGVLLLVFVVLQRVTGRNSGTAS